MRIGDKVRAISNEYGITSKHNECIGRIRDIRAHGSIVIEVISLQHETKHIGDIFTVRSECFEVIDDYKTSNQLGRDIYNIRFFIGGPEC